MIVETQNDDYSFYGILLNRLRVFIFNPMNQITFIRVKKIVEENIKVYLFYKALNMTESYFTLKKLGYDFSQIYDAIGQLLTDVNEEDCEKISDLLRNIEIDKNIKCIHIPENDIITSADINLY